MFQSLYRKLPVKKTILTIQDNEKKEIEYNIFTHNFKCGKYQVMFSNSS